MALTSTVRRRWMQSAGIGLALILSLGDMARAAEEDLQRLERQQGEYSRQLEALQERLEEARSRPSPERDELLAARARVAEARAAHDAEGSEASAARLQNAEFRLALSERRFDKAHREVESLARQVAELEQRLVANRQSREQLQRRQTRQREQRQREEAEAAQREIRRLRALLAAREAEAAEELGNHPPAEPSQDAADSPGPEPSRPAPAEDSQAPGSPQLLDDPQQVLALLTRAEQLLSDEARPNLVNRILHLKHGNHSRAYTLRALGEEAYRAELELEAGALELVVGLNRWPLTLSASGRHVLLYFTDESPPTLYLYPSELEAN